MTYSCFEKNFKWQVCSGITGRFQPEWVAGLDRNQWQVWAGICRLPFQSDFFGPSSLLKNKATISSNKGTDIIGIKYFASHIYKRKWDAKKKNWGPTKVHKYATAYTYLKSSKLKKTLQKLRGKGYKFIIFPDFPNHLHLAEY